MVRLGRFFVLVQIHSSAQNIVMKTVRLSWLVGCVLVALGVTAFAGTDGSQITRESTRRADHKTCYAILGSSIPQPCDRFTGPFPTTAQPIDIYGKRPRRSH